MRMACNLAQQKSYDYKCTEEVMLRLVKWVQTQNRLVSQPRMVVKNWEGYLNCASTPWEARGPSLIPDSPAQGSSVGEKISTMHGFENQQRFVVEIDGGLLESQAFHLMGLHMSSSAAAAAQKVPGTHGEEVNYLTSRQEWWCNSLPDRTAGRKKPLFLCWTLP